VSRGGEKLGPVRIGPGGIKERQILTDEVLQKTQKRQQQFVKVPCVWMERLEGARYVATYRVAWHVLFRNWQSNGKPFTLSNGAVKGVSRWQKWRALQELERLGLVTVERRKRKTPLICCIYAA
jgi:hypothetical protein